MEAHSNIKSQKTRYTKLLNKYKYKQKGEVYSGQEVSGSTYHLKEKSLFVDQIKDCLNLSNDEVTQVKYTIYHIRDLSVLLANAKWETIVVGLCMAAKEGHAHRRMFRSNNKVLRKYKLTEHKYSTILLNLLALERRDKPMKEFDYSAMFY